MRLSTAERVGAGGGVGGMGNGGAGGAGGGYEARWAAGEGEEAVPHAIRLGRGVLLVSVEATPPGALSSKHEPEPARTRRKTSPRLSRPLSISSGLSERCPSPPASRVRTRTLPSTRWTA